MWWSRTILLDRLIEQHRKAVRAARRDDDILGATVAAVGELGFDRVALVQMIWFLRPEPEYFCLDNYGEWHDIYIARQYHRRDPAHLAAQRTNRCFSWNELASIVGASHVHRPILREAARHGLLNGMTIPIGVPGEPAGSGSLGTRSGRLPPRDQCRAAAWIVDEAFAEVRRVHGHPARLDDMTPPLSPRRLECLRLVAVGRTDVAIATKMGISVTTVRTHLAHLRQVYGVRTRTQLARLAVHFGLVEIDDIIPQY